MAHPDEVKEWAKELYIIDGLTLEQTAKKTELPIQTIKAWSADEGWYEQKRANRAALTAIRQKTLELQQKLTEKALETLDPQAIYALSRLRRATRQEKSEEQVADVDRPKVFLEDLEFIAETLKELDPEGLKILSRNFETIVQKFKNHVAADQHR